ncbi:hypothetical protein [Streptomyces sp. GbtcB7]|uniref:hypothetical protein n=1 Tax=Streptomyces sp. GbtcB7 TaxID=2824752 RepID=UPI001C301F02|nr:hypothetical protein [Streptomyces sp. GbtcB7]
MPTYDAVPEGGLTANWITDDSTFHLIDRAHYVITPRYTWKQIDDAAELAALNGARILVEWHCTADGSGGRPCPDRLIYGAARGNAGVGCGKMHLQWETPRLVDRGPDDYGTMAAFSVGRVLVDAATGKMDSLFVPSREDKRAGRYGETGDGSNMPLPPRGVSSLGLTITIDIPTKTVEGREASGSTAPETVPGPTSFTQPAKCPGCGRPAAHRALYGVQLHYPGCSAQKAPRPRLSDE